MLKKEPPVGQLQIEHTKKASQRETIFRGLLIFAIISAAVLTIYAKSTPYFSIDLAISLFIQQFRDEWIQNLMVFISEVGSVFWGTTLAILFALVFVLLKQYREGLMILISTGGAGLISLFFKAIVARPRPDPNLINQIGEFLYFDSFPSGHVLHYVGLYGMLSYLIFIHFKDSPIKYFLNAFCTLIIILGAVSRIYLGAHWFSDTLGAALIGFVWLYLVISIYLRVTKHKHLKAGN